MNKALIFLAILSISATAAVADNTMPRADAVMQPKAAVVQASKQMSDADLDNVTAGFQTIYNNSKKMKIIQNGKLETVVVIIGARYVPEPPPPPPGP